MRTDPRTKTAHDIEDLQSQIDELRLRTENIETVLSETTSQPRAPGRRESQNEPRVGDLVEFRPTRITPGGTGQVTRIVRNFVLIRRANGTIVQRAPRNVRILRRAVQDGEQA